MLMDVDGCDGDYTNIDFSIIATVSLVKRW